MGPNTDHGRAQGRAASVDDLYGPPDVGPPSPRTLIDGRTDPGRLDDSDGGTPDDSVDFEADLLGPEGGVDSATRPLALQRALREVEASVDAELITLQARIDDLREAEDTLQDRLEQLYLELGTLRDGLVENGRELRDVLNARLDLGTRRCEQQATSIQRTLLADAAALHERSQAWADRQAQAEARLRAFKEDPELAEKIAEFRRLDERMDTLELLPESYRLVVKRHHTELKEKLRPHLEEPPKIELLPLRLSVAVGVAGGREDTDHDDHEGGAGRVLAVLPVDFATHGRAREGKSDLAARFAFRVLAALSRFVVNIGARTDPRPVDLGGLLGIELPFDDLDIPVAPLDLARALRDSFADAHDSQMAKVLVSTEMVFVATDALELLWSRAGHTERKPAPTPPAVRRPRRTGSRRAK